MRLRNVFLAGVAILAVAPASFANEPSLSDAHGMGPVSSMGSPVGVGPANAHQSPAQVDQNPLAGRGASLPPVVNYLMSEGVKVVALGEAGGMRTYLGEAANGRFQAFYVTPDGEHVLAGLMFAAGGHNMTTDQISAMLKRFGDAARKLPNVNADLLPKVPDEAAVVEPKQDFLDWLAANKMKTTAFDGTEGGVQGYLVETPSENATSPGKIQPMYISPDRKHAVVGVLIRRGGTIVTGVQIGEMQARYVEEERAKKNGLSTPVDTEHNIPQGQAISEASAKAITEDMTRKGAEALGQPASAAAVADPKNEGVSPVVSGSKPQADTPSDNPATALPPPKIRGEGEDPIRVPDGIPKPVSMIKAISTKPPAAADTYLYPGSDVQTFLEALKTTVFFTVGQKDRPVIWMVADPQCPFCHLAWSQLKPLVFDGKIQVRVILMAGLKNSDRFTRSILSRQEPARAWLTGEGSIESVTIKDGAEPGTASWNQADTFMRTNNAFAQRYQIRSTPFLAYTTDEGKLYSTIGMPPDMDAFLAALR